MWGITRREAYPTTDRPQKIMLQLKKGLNAEGVEINGRTQLHPATMSRTAVRHFLKTLGDLNLSVAAIHFPTRRSYGEVEDLERRIDATKAAMSMAYELGCNVVVNRIGNIPEQGTDNRQQPVTETMKALAEHVAHFRARDAVQDLSLGQTSEVQLGRGSVDWSSLLGLLEEKGYQGFLTVQRDAESNAIEQCGESLEYLDQLFR